MDMVYEPENADFLDRLRIGLHLWLCADCARKARRVELCAHALREGFPPPSPGLEEAVMSAVSAEECAGDETAPAGFSLGGWVAAGIVLLVSLTTVFFGLEFRHIALAAGVSFMLPVGITVGTAVTVYGALLIGSHLKTLSERFELR